MTDKLADLETWARGPLAIATIPRARDVLALVEVARAAQRLGYAEFESADEVLVPRDDFDALAAAVARLQKEGE